MRLNKPMKIVAGILGVVVALLIVGALVGNRDKTSTTATTAPAASADAAAPKPKADIRIVKAKTYCQQDEIVGNVDVVVSLRNVGNKDASGVSVLPIREYATGREVRPIGDTMVDVEVPADGRSHRVWRSYDVGDGEVVAGCRLKIISGAFKRGDIEIPIKTR